MFKPLLYEFLSGEMKSDLMWARYDELLHNIVLGLGSTTGYFGVEGASEHSFSIRTGEDAIALGRHLRDWLQIALKQKI
ncbi:hypothetical protein B7486_35365 [cyanobacterium TDX16]|nr:hypothetical protein B7486_35365 [cyanobacterium TDX16]